MKGFKRVRYDAKNGKIIIYQCGQKKVKRTDWRPRGWILDPDSNTGWTDIYGNKARELTADEYKLVDALNEKSYQFKRTGNEAFRLTKVERDFLGMLCETDLSPEVLYLQEEYGDKELEVNTKDFRICVLDIEIAGGNGGHLPSETITFRRTDSAAWEHLTLGELEQVDGYKNFQVNYKGSIQKYRDTEYAKADFPDPDKTEYPINLITAYDSATGKTTTFGLGEYTGSQDFEYHGYRTEISMLRSFFEWFHEKNFDILTGWNVEMFDLKYIVNRSFYIQNELCETGFVQEALALMSPCHPYVYMRKSEGDFAPKVKDLLVIDYLDLYKKFTYKTETSYKLQAIGMKVCGEGKVEYEGSINAFYKRDWNRFVEYNVQDVLLVKKIDEKKRFLDLAVTFAYQALVPIDKIFSSVATIEGYILRYLHQHKMVMPNRPKEKRPDWWVDENMFIAKELSDPSNPNSEMIEVVQNVGEDAEEVEKKIGRENKAYLDDFSDGDDSRKKEKTTETEKSVLAMYYNEDHTDFDLFKTDFRYRVKGGHVEANPGMYTSSLCFDVASLYPHMIIQYNISPETKVIKPGEEEKKALIESEINGVYFKRTKGILPTIVKRIFDERSSFKKRMFKETPGSDAHNYYNSMQQVRKILINSMYGVMINEFFHFYDPDLARAITRGGRRLIRFLSQKAEKAAIMLARNPKRWFPDAEPFELTKETLSLIDTDSVRGDTLVETDRGEYKIEDLFGLCKRCVPETDNEDSWLGIDCGLKAKCLTPDGKIENREIAYVKQHLVQKELFSLTTHGHEVVMTRDHSAIVRRNGQMIDVKPHEIEEGDEIYMRGVGWTKEFWVRPLGMKHERVYDIEVEDIHNFFGNGILVHNSNHLHFQELKAHLAPNMPERDFLKIMEGYMEKAFEVVLKKKADLKGLEQVIRFKREGVITNELVMAKKKYISILVQNEDEIYDTPKMKTTGVEITRSDTPKWVKDRMIETVNFIIGGCTEQELMDRVDAIWEDFRKQDLEVICSNGSVSNYHKYTDLTGKTEGTRKRKGAKKVEKKVSSGFDAFVSGETFVNVGTTTGLAFRKGTPMRNKAAVAYNIFLRDNELPYEKIGDGSKIRYIPVINVKDFKNDVMAWVEECPKEIRDIIKVDYEKQFQTFTGMVNRMCKVLGFREWKMKSKFNQDISQYIE